MAVDRECGHCLLEFCRALVDRQWGVEFEIFARPSTLDAALRLGRRLRDRGFAHPVRLELHRMQPSVAPRCSPSTTT